MSKSDTPGRKNQAQDGGTLGDAYDRVTDRVSAAYDTAREKAGDAVHGAAVGVEANPLVALLGGLALGAIAGILIPRLDKERELLAPVGARVGDALRAALEAGRSAGSDALAESGLGTDNLRQQAGKLFEHAATVATAAGTAAVGAARDKATR